MDGAMEEIFNWSVRNLEKLKDSRNQLWQKKKFIVHVINNFAAYIVFDQSQI